MADVAGPSPAPPAGEWNADQILAHVSIVNAATIAAASCVTSGANTTYDNRTSADPLLLSNGRVLVDQPIQLRDIITGLAEAELPGHTTQLLALLPVSAGSDAAT